MRQVTFETTYPPDAAHPIQQEMTTDGAVTRSELLIWGPTADVTTLSWFDGEPSAVTAVLDAVESTAGTHLVAADDGTYAFVRQTAYELPDSVLTAVAQSRVVFVPPVRFEADGRVRYDAVGESTALAAFHDDIDHHFETSIRQVRDFRGWPNPAPVTDRQRDALEAAVAVGYYEVPRTGTVEDVASELDCARSTAGELVRRAESAVVTAAIEGL